MIKPFPLFLVCSFIICVSCKNEPTSAPPSSTPPNILLIIADDLGYTDLGCYGSEIRTPNIDALTQTGIRTTSFCTAPTCSPTRGMLLSGVVTHRNGYGTMEGDWADNQKGVRGYEGHLNFDVVAFPKLLQDAGYHTSIAGKWHQAFPPSKQDLWPINRGFDRSFCLGPGGAGHFSDKQPLLEKMGEAFYIENDHKVDSLPDDFYSSRFYTDKVIEYINESQELEKPFFSFLSFTAPHWPLQVPDEYADLYKGKYDEGYEVLSKKRLEKGKALGVIPENAVLPPLSPNVLPWEELDPTEQQKSARTMEIYAAMIERVDFHVGRVIEHLKNIGQYDNTLIVFMADNGAEGNSIFGYPGTREWVARSFDNSMENMGRKNSYILTGPSWAQVSSLPFRWYKAFSTEGGVRAPAIFSYSKWTDIGGKINSDFISVMDLAPTFLELAGVEHPDTVYQGRKIYPMNGISMLPWLSGKVERVHPENKVHIWELYGRRGVRQGDWKATWVEQPYCSGEWELYNLVKDIGELNNLAEEQPERLEALIKEWEDYVERNEVTLPDRPTAYSVEDVWREQ